MKHVTLWWVCLALLGGGSLGQTAPVPAPATIHEALTQLTAADPAVKARAVIRVGAEPTEEFLDRIFPLARDSDWRVRQAVAFALGRHPQRNGPSILTAYLEDPHPAVLEAAVLALGQQGDAAAVPQLLKLLERFPQDDHLGWAVEVALGQCTSDHALTQRVHADIMARHQRDGYGTDLCPQTREQLIEHLYHPYAFVKRHALSIVGGWKDPQLIDVLIRAMEDADTAVRQQTLWCLDQYRPLQDARILQAFIRALGDRMEIVRVWSGYGLTGFGEKGLEALRTVITSGDPWSRWGAASALGLFGESALPVLTRALQDRDARVRETALEALAKTGAAGVTKIIELLQDRDATVRKMAVKSLGKLSVPAEPDPHAPKPAAPIGQAAQHAEAMQRVQRPVLQALERALGDAAVGVRQEAVYALGHQGPLGLPGLRRAIHDTAEPVSQSAFYALGSMGREAAPVLKELLTDPSPKRRALAIRSLGRMKEIEAAPAVATCFRDPEPDVRAAAATAFGEWGRLEELTLLASDPEPSVRGAVVRVLAHAQQPQALAGLTLLLQDRHAEIRRHAVVGLSGAGPAALPMLFRAMEDAAPVVRREAVAVLAGRADPDTPVQFAKRLNDEDTETVRRLVAALEHWEPRPITVVMEAARSPSKPIQQRAVWILSLWGDERSAGVLQEAVKDPDPLTRAAAVQGLGRLTLLAPGSWWRQAATDPAPSVRSQAAWVLGKFRPAEGVALHLALLGDPEADVRLAALRGLKRLESAQALTAVLARCADSHAPARELAADLLGSRHEPEVTRVLLTLAADPDRRVRRAVMKGLSQGPRPGAPAIWLNALGDADEAVRVSAVKGLGAVKDASAASVLIAVLEDGQLSVRRAAIESLAGMVSACRPALRAGLTTGSQAVRLGVIDILRDSRDPEAAAMIRLALDHADPEVVQAARVALETLGESAPMFQPAPK